MSLRSPSTQKTPHSRRIVPAQQHTMGGLGWTVYTLARKKLIDWQDRFGLYAYSHWIRTVERREIRRRLSASPVRELPSVCFLILIPDQLCSLDALERTLASLPAQPGANCSLQFLLPKNIQAPVWLEDLVAEAADQPVSSQSVAPRGNWIAHAETLPGEWFVPLAPGDRLSPHWLALLAQAITQNPQADLVYWDEDRISSTGRRFEPFFKPDWSPELLFSLNYLECAAFRKRLLVENASAPGEIFALAQRANSITRIPLVLQHRAEESDAQRLARLHHHAEMARVYLAAQGYANAEVDVSGSHLRVHWQTAAPLVSIIIPTKNNLDYLRRCLTSLFEKTDYSQYEVILMDDHSSDPDVQAYYRDLLGQQPNLRIIENEPGAFNYSRVNNHGSRLAKGDLLLFLNNDVEILSAGWLTELVRWAEMPGVGMVGAKLLYPDGAIQHAGIVLGMTGHANHVFAGRPPIENPLFISSAAYRNVSAVTGACMLVRRNVFEQIGGFNEALSLVFNDVELGLRVLKHGCRIVYTPAAELIHYEGRSRAHYIPPENIRLGAELLRAFIQAGDPYYNPNLSLEVNWPSLRRAHQPDPLQQLTNIVRYKG